MSKSVYEMSDDEIMDMTNLPESDETENTDKDQKEDQDQIKVEEVNNESKEENTSSNEDLNSDNNESDDTNSSSLRYDPEFEENNTKSNASDENSDTIQDDKNDSSRYEEFYKRVMAPFKANGKTVQLNSAEEAISLMQKGVDYTRKMQDIARYRKPILMLEQANLLNEDQLSFLIDLNNGNQEAIRKLLKEKNIDAFDLPSNEEPINYIPGSHNVTDEEVNFKSLVEDIKDRPNGTYLLRDIKNMDNDSKVLLYKNPAFVEQLYAHVQQGYYSKIVNEIERLKTIGQIRSNAPFLQVYNTVGAMLFGQQNTNTQKGRTGYGIQQPLLHKSAITSNRFNNSQRAKSAGLTRSSPTTSYVSETNPLAMSDEEFIKRFGE